MKLLLLCLGLTLVCAQEGGNHEVVTSNIDLSKILGEWYTVMLASGVREMIEENGTLRIFVESLEEMANSSLLFQYHRKYNGKCVKFPILCPLTNGVYSAVYDGYNLFHIVETVYNEYIAIFIRHFQNGTTTKYMKIFGQKPDLSPNVKKWFEELCVERGIPRENVLDVTTGDRCLYNRGSNGTQASSRRLMLSEYLLQPPQLSAGNMFNERPQNVSPRSPQRPVLSAIRRHQGG
ncbi:allergen Fel d 4-like [Saccopteryx bilineata]|uniref:allergen Fel d 4-like n=1 Tax=Saccopteryx bilineata TaxID=59482 RepID=UPI00338F1BA9